MVLKRRPWTRNALPGSSGLLGLMVATSKVGEAFASMGGSLGVGGGIVHSVSGVARVKLRGRGLGPWLQLPVIDFPSALNLPSYVPPAAVTDIFTVVPSRVILVTGMGSPL